VGGRLGLIHFDLLIVLLHLLANGHGLFAVAVVRYEVLGAFGDDRFNVALCLVADRQIAVDRPDHSLHLLALRIDAALLDILRVLAIDVNSNVLHAREFSASDLEVEEGPEHHGIVSREEITHFFDATGAVADGEDAIWSFASGPLL